MVRDHYSKQPVTAIKRPSDSVGRDRRITPTEEKQLLLESLEWAAINYIWPSLLR